MARYVLMTDKATGRVAVYLDDESSGLAKDPNAPRNAPLNSPAGHLGRVRFHSDFDYYLVHSITGVTVNHPSLGGGSYTINDNFPKITRTGTIGATEFNILEHGLGYVPAYMIVSDDALIGPTSIIQVASNRARTITPFATTTHIAMRDFRISSSSSISGITKNYTIIVFRAPVEDSDHLFDFKGSTDEIIMGRGKFRGSLRALRQTLDADASRFDIALGRTIDIKNGGSRTVLPDGTVFEDSWYNGSFAGSDSIQCTVE